MDEGLMTDPTEEFFRRLDQSHPRQLPKRIQKTFRIDLVNGERVDTWLVEMDKGTVRVSREERPTDGTMRTEKSILDGLVSGKLEALPLLLLNMISIEGDYEIGVIFRKLLPDHVGAHDPRTYARERIWHR